MFGLSKAIAQETSILAGTFVKDPKRKVEKMEKIALTYQRNKSL
jgi:hypothetical protein